MRQCNTGFLIAVEGIDGSGKTTLAGIIRDKLICKGIDVLSIPSGGFHSSDIESQLRQIVIADKSGITTDTETFIYFASLSQKVGQYIIPALFENKVVIVDRFILSTFVLSHYMLHQDRQFVKEMLRFASKGITPDFTFLCDLDESIAYSRLISRGKALSRREKQGLSLMSELRKGFLKEVSNSSKNFEIIRTDSIPLDKIEVYVNVLEQYLC